MILLKLGGSLITNKKSAFSARVDVIKRIGLEILKAKEDNPDLKLIIGHGSGSFGHHVATQYGTRDHVCTQEQWLGFQKVWFAARQLNQIVIETFNQIGLPIICFPPSGSIITSNRTISNWNLEPIMSALNNDLIPVIYGDVVFDNNFGGIILSTEDLFLYLTKKTRGKAILIAGIEEGVWQDYPQKNKLISLITPRNFELYANLISSSTTVDVTGGMQAKVNLMLSAVKEDPDLNICIFSGEENDNIKRSLLGQQLGTAIRFN